MGCLKIVSRKTIIKRQRTLAKKRKKRPQFVSGHTRRSASGKKVKVRAFRRSIRKKGKRRKKPQRILIKQTVFRDDNGQFIIRRS